MGDRRASTFAQAFVAVHGLDCAKRLWSIAPGLGLDIEEVDADNFEGALIRAIGLARGCIVLNRAIPEPGRRLFTLAHEVGHYVLPDHDREIHPCGREDLENFDPQLAAREREANVFAAEITMPEEIVRPLAFREPSWAAVDELASQCGTSLTASAFRVVGRTNHALAMVWSVAGKVCWYHRSSEFLPKVRVDELAPTTVAADAFKGHSLPDTWVQVPAEAWLYADAVREDAVIREHSRFLPGYDATLTLLHATEIIESHSDYDDPDDEELQPGEFTLQRNQWPTRQRRR